MATNDFNVNGVVQEKRGKLYVVLSWYESGRRKQNWIATGLEEKGNRRKAQSMVPLLVEEKQEELERTDKPKSPADWYVTEFILIWLDGAKHSLAPSTYAGYKRFITNQFIPYFEDKKLKVSEVTPMHLQNYCNYLVEETHIKATSVKTYFGIIGKFFSHCLKCGYIPVNPIKMVNLPKKQKFEAKFLNAEQTRHLFLSVEGKRLETPVKMAIWYGMRRSEIAGLKWECVDFEKNQIEIKGIIDDRTEEKRRTVYLERTKTEGSHRILPLFPEAKEYLLSLKKVQEENKAQFGSSYNIQWEEFVCVDMIGNLISPYDITTGFPKLLIECDLPIIRFHDLRHTNATLLLAAGANMKDVQCWLGHTNYSTTANVYGHVLESNKISLGNTIASIVNF